MELAYAQSPHLIHNGWIDLNFNAVFLCVNQWMFIAICYSDFEIQGSGTVNVGR